MTNNKLLSIIDKQPMVTIYMYNALDKSMAHTLTVET